MGEHVEVLKVLERELLLACRSKGVDCEICKSRSEAINAAIASLSFPHPQPVTPASDERPLSASELRDM